MHGHKTWQAVSLVAGAIFLAVSPLAVPARAADFTDFYPVAEETILHPPKIGSLMILCSKKVARGAYYSFVGDRDGKIVLMALTEKKIKDLEEVISLKVNFIASPTAIFPVARPGRDEHDYRRHRRSGRCRGDLSRTAIPAVGPGIRRHAPGVLGLLRCGRQRRRHQAVHGRKRGFRCQRCGHE